MTKTKREFGIGLPEVFSTGFRGFRDNVVALCTAGAITLLTFAAIQFPIDALVDDGSLWTARAVNLLSIWVAAVVAHPWFRIALGAADGEQVTFAEAMRDTSALLHQAVASFWFVAGVLLGLQYFGGLPSILVFLLYAFYGYVIADGASKGGLTALGTSVRLGEGRRIGMFAVGALLSIFILIGALPLGFDLNPVTWILSLIGLVITTSIALVAGGAVYRVFKTDLDEEDRKAARSQKGNRTRKQGRKK